MQSRNKAAAGARLRQSRAGAKARQEHGRSRQEQCKSRTGALYLYLLPVSAPMQYFVGRSRAGAGQEQGRSKAGAGQDQGRSRVEAA